MSDTDLQLLARYTRQHAEDAFTELVRRHLDLVYSAALRQVRSPQLAEEVAQSTFTDLARNAARLKPDTILTAWLYQVTRRTAIDVVRSEARRQLREQIATEMNVMNATTSDWTQIEPLLDEAMAALDETDRAAVLLRYFENKSLREVGAALGTSDDAAQKRVSRAVERLREFFAKRGVTVGAGGLVVVISANAVQAAPVGLAVTISAAAAIAGTTITSTANATAIKTIAMTTLQKTLVTATVVASLATPLAIRHHLKTLLRNQGQTIRHSADQLAHLQLKNEEFSKLLAEAKSSRPISNDQFDEVLKLRGEIGRLLADVQELSNQTTNMMLSRADVSTSMREMYADRIRSLKQLFVANPAEAVPELQYLSDRQWLGLVEYSPHRLDPDTNRLLSSARDYAQMDFAKAFLYDTLRQYGKNNNGQFPTELSQLTPYFKSSVDEATLQHWTILPRTSLPKELSVDEDWVITQKAPINAEYDQRIAVGFKTIRLGLGANQWQWGLAPYRP